MRVSNMVDVMAGRESAEILCRYKKVVVRTLTIVGDVVHMVTPNGDNVDIPLEEPVVYKPWFMDRGNMLVLGEKIKLCTEADYIRYPDGEQDDLIPACLKTGEELLAEMV